MDKLFWLIPGRLAGRPGPDQEPWDLKSLRTGGIGAILSVNDGLSCPPDDFKAHGISYACMPLANNAPPLPGDDQICLRVLPQAYRFVQTEMRKGHAVVVHCSAGKDRTGLFLCYFLTQYVNLSAEEAITAVRQVRPIALSASGWEDLTKEVLSSFESTLWRRSLEKNP